MPANCYRESHEQLTVGEGKQKINAIHPNWIKSLFLNMLRSFLVLYLESIYRKHRLLQGKYQEIFLKNLLINTIFAKLFLKDSFTYPGGQTLQPPSWKSHCWAAGWSPQWHRLARAVDEEDFTRYGNLFLLCGVYLTITAGLTAIFPSFVLMQTLMRWHQDWLSVSRGALELSKLRDLTLICFPQTMLHILHVRCIARFEKRSEKRIKEDYTFPNIPLNLCKWNKCGQLWIHAVLSHCTSCTSLACSQALQAEPLAWPGFTSSILPSVSLPGMDTSGALTGTRTCTWIMWFFKIL